MRLILALATSLILAGCGRAATTQPAGPPAPAAPAAPVAPPAKVIVSVLLPAKPGAAAIKVTSEAVGADGAIDRRYTAYGDNLSPPVSWTPVPDAKAYAVILEDPDAPGDTPFLHWAIWNIPSSLTALPAGVPGGRKALTPGAAIQGLNGVGDIGFFGPRPPAGSGAHHYHFQVFALDAPLAATIGADLHTVTEAMKGHVVGGGELVGTFSAPATP